jgi:predicted nucleotidyltransferase component of viral defense system
MNFFRRRRGNLFFSLAAYYLQHRLSKDIDLFTTNDEAFALARNSMDRVAAALGCELVRRASSQWFQQFFFAQNEIRLQVDLVRDADIHFGEHKRFGKVIVDARENIGANKITAIFGRTESKDFVDLYFLLHAGLEFDELLKLAKEKDKGLTEFFLAGMMRQVVTLRDLPMMLKPIDLETMRRFYLELARKLMLTAKPE